MVVGRPVVEDPTGADLEERRRAQTECGKHDGGSLGTGWRKLRAGSITPMLLEGFDGTPQITHGPVHPIHKVRTKTFGSSTQALLFVRGEIPPDRRKSRNVLTRGC